MNCYIFILGLPSVIKYIFRWRSQLRKHNCIQRWGMESRVIWLFREALTHKKDKFSGKFQTNTSVSLTKLLRFLETLSHLRILAPFYRPQYRNEISIFGSETTPLPSRTFSPGNPSVFEKRYPYWLKPVIPILDKLKREHTHIMLSLFSGPGTAWNTTKQSALENNKNI